MKIAINASFSDFFFKGIFVSNESTFKFPINKLFPVFENEKLLELCIRFGNRTKNWDSKFGKCISY